MSAAEEWAARRAGMVALYRSGASAEQVAAEFGISRPRVCIVLTEEGVLAHRPRPHQTERNARIVAAVLAGASTAEVAEREGISRSIVQQVLHRKGVRLRGTTRQVQRPPRPPRKAPAPKLPKPPTPPGPTFAVIARLPQVEQPLLDLGYTTWRLSLPSQHLLDLTVMQEGLTHGVLRVLGQRMASTASRMVGSVEQLDETRWQVRVEAAS